MARNLLKVPVCTLSRLEKLVSIIDRNTEKINTRRCSQYQSYTSYESAIIKRNCGSNDQDCIVCQLPCTCLENFKNDFDNNYLNC